MRSSIKLISAAGLSAALLSACVPEAELPIPAPPSDDTTAPVITEGALIGDATTNMPLFTFESSEAGTIKWSGSCSSSTKAAVEGVNEIHLASLETGSYSDCQITVTDSAENESQVLAITPFTVAIPACQECTGKSTILTEGGSTGTGLGEVVVMLPDGKYIVMSNDAIPGKGSFPAFIRLNSNGSQDFSFGNDERDGKVNLSKAVETLGFYPKPERYLQQSDGKLVFMQHQYVPLTQGGSKRAIALTRFDVDGNLDETFGDAGVCAFFPADTSFEFYFMMQQKDGKFVVAGHVKSSTDTDMAVVRFNADGNIDTDFGDNGIFTHDVNAWTDKAYSVAQQADGKLVVVGVAHDGLNGSSSGLDTLVVRLTTDGRLDSDFANGGVATEDIYSNQDPLSLMDYAGAVIQQSDGKLVVAGYASLPGGNFSISRGRRFFSYDIGQCRN